MAALVLGLVLAGLILEGIVRGLSLQGDVFKKIDPEVYVGYAPGATGTYVSPAQPTIRTPIRINRDGYRGPDFDRNAKVRVAFVGDSFTVAMEVPYEKCFVHRVQADLAAHHPSAACYNFGVDGSGTGLQLLHFTRRAVALDPQLVVLQITVGNDFVDNSRELNWKKYYPSWSFDGKELSLRPPEVGVPPIMNLARRSRAAGWLYRRYRSLARKQPKVPCTENALYLRAARPEWRRAYRLTLELISRFVEEAHDNGIVPVVVLIPTSCQVIHAPQADARFDLLHPQKRIRQKLGDRARLIDLLPLFQAESERLGDPLWYRFDRDGHFNEVGHAFVSAVLSRTILEQLGPSVADPLSTPPLPPRSTALGPGRGPEFDTSSTRVLCSAGDAFESAEFARNRPSSGHV